MGFREIEQILLSLLVVEDYHSGKVYPVHQAFGYK